MPKTAIRSSPRACGMARSRARRAARTALATTPCFSSGTWAGRPRSSTPPTRTASAIAASRCRSSSPCCMNPVAVERPGVVQLALLPPLALYVHIPWCVRKCPYCDFNSHERSGALPSGVRARLPLEPGAEVTLEANPGTVEAARFRGFRDAGVNRISIGVQSFDDRMLARLGRIHSAGEARKAIDAALASFERVNVDLMYGLPGQELAEATADIEQAIAAGAPHISAYQLTIEPNTV